MADPTPFESRRSRHRPRCGRERGLRDQARHRRAGRDAGAGLRPPAGGRTPPDRGSPRPGEDADHQDRRRGDRREFQRVQFTPDLVPSDLVGTRMYRSGKDEFDTELGPVFCNFLLADEINRAPAKVQSALLEVMQERQVTIGKETHAVPSPFLVMATQNPIESEGTYPLPEAQVDRFMLKVLVDYPEPGRRADGDRARARRSGHGRAAAHGRGAGGAAGCAPADLRRPGGLALRALDRAGHAAARRGRPGGSRLLRRLRSQPARPDQPRRRRARPRAPARPPLRAAAGRPRARQGRAPAPDGAQLRGARRRRRRGSDPRPRARDDRRCRTSTWRGRTSHEHRPRSRPGPHAGPSGPRPAPGCAAAQGEPGRSAADRRHARRRPPLVGARRRCRARPGPAVRGRRRRPAHRLERDGPHRRAAHSRQRGRAGRRDLAAARHLCVDDVRDRRPEEVGRRGRRLARGRQLRRPPWQPSRGRHLRRPEPLHLAGPAGQSRPPGPPPRARGESPISSRPGRRRSVPRSAGSAGSPAAAP